MLVGGVFTDRRQLVFVKTAQAKQRRIAFFACVKAFLHEKIRLVKAF